MSSSLRSTTQGSGASGPRRVAPRVPTSHLDVVEHDTSSFIERPLQPTAARQQAPGEQLQDGYLGSYLDIDPSGNVVPRHGFIPEDSFADNSQDDDDTYKRTGGRPPRRHGRGLMVYGDRTVYEGDWVDDERHGSGICFFPSGNIYIGSFAHGHMEGQGSMLYHDGDFFTGSFLQSACHGIGMYYSGGTEIRGEWRHGVRVATAHNRAVNVLEDFDGHRLHYETFAAVLRQLHGHFAFYALFDNRFRRPTNDASGVPEPRPHLVRGPTISVDAATETATPLLPHRSNCTPPAQPGLEAPFTNSGRSPASTTHLLPPIDVVASAAAASSDEEGLVGAVGSSFSFHNNIGSSFGGKSHASKQRSPTRQSTHQPFHSAGAQHSQHRAPNLRRRRSWHLDGMRNAPTPSKVGSAAYAVDESAAVRSPPQGTAMLPSPLREPNMALPAVLSVGAAVNDGSVPQLNDRRQHGVDRGVLFASAGPTPNEYFSYQEYIKHAALFMFPLLSVPHLPHVCPLTMSNLDMEREYVVSGAALSHDFKPPKSSVYVAILGFLSYVVLLVIAIVKTGMTSKMTNSVTSIEVVAPAVVWVLFAFVCAGYHGYLRIAHALERLDRHLAPKLAAFAANVVDASADICVFTWDDEGRSKITNAHYKYRWLIGSTAIGACAAFATPVTRAAFEQDPFLTHDQASTAVAGLSVVTLFLFVSGVSYYVLKSTDMQRQVLSQLRVLSRLAYLDGVAITAPTQHRPIHFDFDASVDISDFFDGFVGWWVTRSFIMSSSACSNHRSRSACMSAFILGQITMCLVVMGDVVYAGATGQLRSPTSPYKIVKEGEIYFTAAHSVALVLVAAGGVLTFRYLVACVATRQEAVHHLQLMDVGALFHCAARRDPESAELIKHCRWTAEHHDPLPTLASIRITPFMLLLLTVLNVVAFAVLWVIFANAFYSTP